MFRYHRDDYAITDAKLIKIFGEGVDTDDGTRYNAQARP